MRFEIDTKRCFPGDRMDFFFAACSETWGIRKRPSCLLVEHRSRLEVLEYLTETPVFRKTQTRPFTEGDIDDEGESDNPERVG